MKKFISYAMIAFLLVPHTTAHSYEYQMILEDTAKVKYKILNSDPKMIIYQFKDKKFCNEDGCITTVLFGNYHDTFYAGEYIIIPDTIDNNRAILRFCRSEEWRFCKLVAIHEGGIDVLE